MLRVSHRSTCVGERERGKKGSKGKEREEIGCNGIRWDWMTKNKAGQGERKVDVRDRERSRG
jgi:hypothetical protein